ncbi:MAG: Fe-S cluster assembly sulfur transfer protein SufU [Candidatus Dormibacteria bacterium]
MAVGFPAVQDDLYREIILDHYRNPRHRVTVDPADGTLEAGNPLCGDELVLSWRLADRIVDAIGFTGKGCSISQASASMMCEAVEGLDAGAAANLANRFREMLLHEGSADDIGDLECLQGVRAYPVRIKCALLPWTALLHMLNGGTERRVEVNG